MKVVFTDSSGVQQELDVSKLLVKDRSGNELILIGETNGAIWQLKVGDDGFERYLRSKPVTVSTIKS